MRVSRWMGWLAVGVCAAFASAAGAQEPVAPNEGESSRAPSAQDESGQRQAAPEDRRRGGSSLTLIETQTPETESRPAKKKTARFFFEYSNPFLNAIARFETSAFAMLDDWDPEQSGAFAYPALRNQSDAMANQARAMIAYLEANPGIVGRVPDFTALDVRNISRLARFSVELSRAARLQDRAAFIERWLQVEALLIDFRQKNWWPQPQRLQQTEEESDANASSADANAADSGSTGQRPRSLRKPQ